MSRKGKIILYVAFLHFFVTGIFYSLSISSCQDWFDTPISECTSSVFVQIGFATFISPLSWLINEWILILPFKVVIYMTLSLPVLVFLNSLLWAWVLVNFFEFIWKYFRKSQ